MATAMDIDNVTTQVEYDPDQDHFYGVAELGPGPVGDRDVEKRVVTFYGRDPDALRARFREVRNALLGG